jgi:hypothetical protein
MSKIFEKRILISPAHAHVHNTVRGDELYPSYVVVCCLCWSRRRDCIYAMERSLLPPVIWSEYGRMRRRTWKVYMNFTIRPDTLPRDSKARCASYIVTNTGMTSTRNLLFEIYSIHKRNTHCSLSSIYVYKCYFQWCNPMRHNDYCWIAKRTEHI